MSVINAEITTEAVIPTVSTDLFANNPDARFAVGIIGVGDQVMPNLDNVFDGYLELRKRVYLDQTGMLSVEDLTADGVETDADDNRSIHLAVLENTPINERGKRAARVVASMRLIMKSQEDSRELPVEEFFPEAFETEPTPEDTLEVSRFIARNEDRNVQASLKWMLFAKGLVSVLTRDIDTAYGVVEAPLEKDLIMNGIPVERIADPKYVPEYAADNLGIKIDVPKLAALMGMADPKVIDSLRATEYDFDYSGSMSLNKFDVA